MSGSSVDSHFHIKIFNEICNRRLCSPIRTPCVQQRVKLLAFAADGRKGNEGGHSGDGHTAETLRGLSGVEN